MTRLAITVPFHDDETVTSFCSRTAAANGVGSAREFCQHMGFDFRKAVRGHPEAVDMLAGLTGQDPSLMRTRVIRSEGSFFDVGGEKFTKPQLIRGRSRFCSFCLDDDDATAGRHPFPRAYGRVHWEMSFVIACPIHRVFLTEGVHDNGHGFEHDFIRMLEQTRRGQPKAVPVRAERSAFEEYVTRRLVRGAGSGDWIDELPLRVVVRVTELVGGMLMHGIKFKGGDLDTRQRHEAATAGFEIMSGGRDAFVDYLRSHHTRTLTRTGDFGGRSLYGRLYEMLAHSQCPDPAFDPIRTIIKETTIDHLPVGPGDTLFGPVERRKWHSVHSASVQHRLDSRTLTKYVAAAGIATGGLTPDRILVDVETMEGIVRTMKEGITPPAARKLLHVNLNTWITIVGHGLVKPITPPDTSPIFARKDIEDFVPALMAQKTECFVEDSDMKDIMNARRFARCSLAEVFELLRAGVLRRVSIDPSRQGFHSIFISVSELRAKVRGAELPGLPVYRALKELKMCHRTFTKLASAGLIETAQAVHPENRGMQTIVTQETIDRFNSIYVSLHVLAERRSMNARRLKYMLKAAGVEPKLTRAEYGSSFYLVADVDGSG